MEPYRQMLVHECQKCGNVVRSHCSTEFCCNKPMKAKVAPGEPDPRD